MDVYIETYRGFKIFFNTVHENFRVEYEDKLDRSRRTFSSCRRLVDEFLKDAANFKPFEIVDVGTGDRLKIIGQQKDGVFLYDKNGTTKRISKWDEEHTYIGYIEEMEPFFAEKAQAEELADSYMRKASEIRDAIKSMGTPLWNLKK